MEQQREKEQELIYGRHPVTDAIRAGLSVDKVVLQQGLRGDFEKEVRYLCRERQIPLQVVPRERFSKWVQGNHQGVIAFIAPVVFQRVEMVLPSVYERGEIPFFLVLDGVTDVRNFGAIARTAEVLGVHALVVPMKNTALVNAEAMKASAGALSHIPVCRETSLVNALTLMQESGVRIFGSDLEAGRTIFEVDLTGPSALILGSEGKGIHPALLKMADETFLIPQSGVTDSLNVSVAAGIMVYETVRQRWAIR